MQADGIALIPWKGSRPLVWDATVPDTLAASHIAATSREPGTAAAKAENLKTTKYATLASSNIFVPVAIETLGAYGRIAWLFITKLGLRLATSSGDSQATAKLRRKLAVAVQRGNAISIAGTFNNF